MILDIGHQYKFSECHSLACTYMGQKTGPRREKLSYITIKSYKMHIVV